MKTTQRKINARDGATISMWQSFLPELHPIKMPAPDQIYDALIIGGGITGLTTALLLQKQGKNCLLAEAQNIGFGTTGGTSAHLNTFLDASYPEIESAFSRQAASLMAEASKSMIEMINKNIRELNIAADFEYKDGYLFSENDNESKQLQSILESAQNAGVEVSEASENGIKIPFQRALRFKKQAQFHPLKYINGLAKEFERLGGTILEQTFISSTERQNELYLVRSEDLTLKTKNIVYATHIPPGVNILSLRNAPYRSYVLAIKLKNNDYPGCLAYDMQEPYHYFRSHEIEGQPYLIVGGADHKTGHEDPVKAFEDLESYARKHFKVDAIAYRWSSQYYQPVDGLPYVGQMPGGEKGIFVATGFNGNGMILGSLSAALISDLILGKENPYQQLLSPSRLKPVAGFTEFIRENADVAYHFIADRFFMDSLDSTAQLKTGEGKIVEFEGEKLAIYKDQEGTISALNPVCTHAGCIVNWNAAEKTWDCPCHGGRFNPKGEVISGPPRSPLADIKIDGPKK